MDPSVPQNTSSGQHVQATVLGYANDTTESQMNNYPAALPAPSAAAAAVNIPPSSTTTVSAGDLQKPKAVDENLPSKHVDGEQTALHPHPQQLPPNAPHGPRDFSTGICDFPLSWSICFDAWCCTYCLASAHHNFLVNEQEGVYAPVCCGLLCVDLGLSALSPYLPSSILFHTCFMRHAMRQRYNLHRVSESGAATESATAAAEGTRYAPYSLNAESLLDFVTVCFCLSCTIAQHQREILMQGDWCGGVLSDRHSLIVPERVYTV